MSLHTTYGEAFPGAGFPSLSLSVDYPLVKANSKLTSSTG